MTSKEIRDKFHIPARAGGYIQTDEVRVLAEIAAQLAELNERASDGGFPVQLIGAAATDLHGLFFAAAALQRRKGK